MRILKIGFIISLIAASVGFINFGDTSASETKGIFKISVNKDTEPQITFVKLNEMGVMTASWYGPRFHGRITANGEQYDQMAFTAAHRNLPFGTLLQVTNLKNGKTAIVRINDRGPFIEGRDLDLSKRTALELGMLSKGIMKVKVDKVALHESPISNLD